MSKRRLSEKTDNQFQFRMDADVLHRYMEILRKVEGRNMLATEADVNKRLVGLLPADGLVTQAEINFFRGKAEGKTVVTVRRGEAEGTPKKVEKKKRVNGD